MYSLAVMASEFTQSPEQFNSLTTSDNLSKLCPPTVEAVNAVTWLVC